MEQLDMDALRDTGVALISAWGLKVIGALATLFVGLALAKIIRGASRKGFARANLDPTLIPFLSGIIYYVLIACVLIAVLGMFGVETTSFIAILGAAGLAIGLALQGTLSNFSAGVMLLVFRPFRKGDFVDAGGTLGTIDEIGVFSTTMNSPDNIRIIVPNSAVYGAIIKNFSANDTRRNDMVVGVSYDDDLGVALETIHRVIAGDGRVLKEPAPTVAVSEMADSSMNIVVRPWCKREDYWNLRFDLTRQLKEQLEAAGCSIPYPQRDVHLHQAGPTA